ncbi:MAG: hypothetical protein ACK401_06635, partial [Archaeoglobaceae archaeon]
VCINSLRKNFRLLRCMQTYKVSVEFRKSEVTKFGNVKIDEISVQFSIRRSYVAKFRDVQILPVVLKTRKKTKRG